MASGVCVSSWRFSLAPVGYRSFANFPVVEKPSFRPPPASRPVAFRAIPRLRITRACRQSEALVGGHPSGPPTALLLKLHAIARYRTGSTPCYLYQRASRYTWLGNVIYGDSPGATDAALRFLSGTTFVSDKLAIAARLFSVRSCLAPPALSRTTRASQLAQALETRPSVRSASRLTFRLSLAAPSCDD